MGQEGYFFRKSQVIASAVLVGVLCLIVGLMCGLLPEPQICEADNLALQLREESDRPADVAAAADPMPWEVLRLPEEVTASHYDLLLHPNLTTNYFTGHVDITINVAEAQVYPRLHIKAMDIMSVEIKNPDGSQGPAFDGYWNYVPNQFLVINMTDTLPVGDYVLSIGFGGWLNQTIVGFYKSVYKDAAGNDRAIATSKFQPTDARRAFPCFDEPAYKAAYTTHLVHPVDYFALSNMNNVSTEDYGDGLKVTNFARSVPMSTYLACFIVCQFDFKEDYTADGVPFRVYAPVDQIDQVDYALKVGVNITDFYVTYFDLAYPLPKLDMIAIPDFSSGAMEHWGLITYREKYLLFDEREGSIYNKARINAIVAHELAHMWFGNIVTCAWWDDLWLNEGFASYMEYLGADSAEPSWKMLEQFVTVDFNYVMGNDQIVTSHPIIVPVEHPDEINQIFDSIPYSKGASVIRMLNNIIGESAFKTGVSAFLKDFQYDVAVTDDLWDRLEAAAAAEGLNLDVKRIMDTWTLQMGFPVVTMARDGNMLTGSQEWFLVDPNANKSADKYGSPFDYQWEIPLYYKFQDDAEETREWMYRNDTMFETEFTGDIGDYYIINTGRFGYYRVNYDQDTWAALGQQLLTDLNALLPEERAGTIDDAFNLARASQLSYATALDISMYLAADPEYVPWDTARDNINWLSEMMRFQPGYGLFRKHIRSLTDNLYDTLGWEDVGSHLEKYQRTNILDLACRHGNPKCLDKAVELFYDYLNGSYISPNVRSDVFEYGMQEVGGQEEWNQLLYNYETTDVSTERSRLLYAMGQSRIPWIIANYLDLLMADNSPIKSQDFFSVVSYVASNPVGNPIAWDWIRVNWEAMVERFGLENRYLGRMIPDVVEFYNTPLQLEELEDFYAAYPESGAGSQGRVQSLEKLQTNINWVEENADEVYQWLQDNVM